MTASELGTDALRYAREAGSEWVESFKDSAASHLMTALGAIVVYQLLRWIA